jgi:hypothetical protein
MKLDACYRRRSEADHHPNRAGALEYIWSLEKMSILPLILLQDVIRAVKMHKGTQLVE